MPVYQIGGCDVLFPHQAYGTQLGFMSKMISALEGGANALLEAPTGSGKTLSLLCAALAWQAREKARVEEGASAAAQAQAAAHAAAAAAAAGGGDAAAAAAAAAVAAAATPCAAGGAARSPDSALERSGGSGATAPGSGDAPAHAAPAAPAAPLAAPVPVPPLGDGGFIPGAPSPSPGAPGAEPPRARAPRIYYATRTHSQIAQVVRELKRSGYKPRMAVLAAKRHYCVNAHARGTRAVDEACDDLLKEGDCQYFRGVAGQITSDVAWRVHDVEDLCKVSARRRALLRDPMNRRDARGTQTKTFKPTNPIPTQTDSPTDHLATPSILECICTDDEGAPRVPVLPLAQVGRRRGPRLRALLLLRRPGHPALDGRGGRGRRGHLRRGAQHRGRRARGGLARAAARGARRGACGLLVWLFILFYLFI
jgi:hypothetical protein